MRASLSVDFQPTATERTQWAVDDTGDEFVHVYLNKLTKLGAPFNRVSVTELFSVMMTREQFDGLREVLASSTPAVKAVV